MGQNGEVISSVHHQPDHHPFLEISREINGETIKRQTKKTMKKETEIRACKSPCGVDDRHKGI